MKIEMAARNPKNKRKSKKKKITEIEKCEMKGEMKKGRGNKRPRTIPFIYSSTENGVFLGPRKGPIKKAKPTAMKIEMGGRKRGQKWPEKGVFLPYMEPDKFHPRARNSSLLRAY